MTNCNPSRRECYPCNREKMLPLHREIHMRGQLPQGSHAFVAPTPGFSRQLHWSCQEKSGIPHRFSLA